MGWYSAWLGAKIEEFSGTPWDLLPERPRWPKHLDCRMPGCPAKACSSAGSPYCYPHATVLLIAKGLPQAQAEQALQALIDINAGRL